MQASIAVSPSVIAIAPGEKITFQVSSDERDPILVRLIISGNSTYCQYIKPVPRIIYLPPNYKQKVYIYVPPVKIPKGEYVCKMALTYKTIKFVPTQTLTLKNNQIVAGVVFNFYNVYPILLRSQLSAEDLEVKANVELKNKTLIVSIKKTGYADFAGYFDLIIYKGDKRVKFYTQDVNLGNKKPEKSFQYPLDDLPPGKYRVVVLANERFEIGHRLWTKARKIYEGFIELK